jgi:hypothetical protein
MAIESAYRELFSESVTVYPPVSLDKYGRRTASASGQVIPAHYVSEVTLSRDADGREVVETGQIYLYGYFPNISTDYLIKLQDSSCPIIVGVDAPHDQNGGHHTVIRIGRK